MLLGIGGLKGLVGASAVFDDQMGLGGMGRASVPGLLTFDGVEGGVGDLCALSIVAALSLLELVLSAAINAETLGYRSVRSFDKALRSVRSTDRGMRGLSWRGGVGALVVCK